MPLPQPASLRDRTPEFLVLCERLQRQHGPSNSAGPSTSTANKQIQGSHSDFAKKAAEIGHGIHRTSLKLQKLAQLAKRTSMFDDPAAEVDELTGIIKQDIQQLNNTIAELQRTGARKGDDNKQSTDHSHTVVDSLRTRLKDATHEFKEVLTVRTENLKHHKERRQLFSDSASDADATAPLLRPRQPTLATSNGTSNHQQPPALPSFLQQQQQQQQLTLAAPQDSYLTSRAEALRNVETTIVELGTIFNKLSEMVAQQGEMAIRIDENVEDTLANVSSAQAQLLKYLEHHLF
ncbi:hypothetical protein QJQ45_006637 [Haematococcus lacustris]|nr:hypothetical protein QJQ45_006637 [Haematococcus lacustris]